MEIFICKFYKMKVKLTGDIFNLTGVTVNESGYKHCGVTPHFPKSIEKILRKE